MELLLNDSRIDPNLTTRRGMTALMLAGFAGRNDVVKILLSKKGLDVNAINSEVPGPRKM